MIVDFSNQQKRLIQIGNAAHEIRNILAMKKRQDLPELQALDNASADIENKARQLVTILDEKEMRDLGQLMNSKPLLKVIFREQKFMLRILEDIQALDYESLQNSYIEQIKSNIEFQQKFLIDTDKFINDIFINHIVSQNISDRADPQLKNEFDFSEKINLKSLEPNNLQSLEIISKLICNRAHQLQNLICPYQNKEKQKIEANQINNIAGNIENQLRAILQGIDVEQKNIEQIKKIITNQSKAAKEQILQLKNNEQKYNTVFSQNLINQINDNIQQIERGLEIYNQVINSKPGEIIFAL